MNQIARRLSSLTKTVAHLPLDRHSSGKTIHSFLSKHSTMTSNISSDSKDDLVDALSSHLSYKKDIIVDEESISFFCDQLLEAHAVLRNRGVVICPTNVGYTLITTRNVPKMKSLKGRPDGKPCGIVGTSDIYKATFGDEPPLKSGQHIVGYLGKPILSRKELPEGCIGPKGEFGIWTQCGPVGDYLAKRCWIESREYLVGTSCNMAGEGNPQSEQYCLSYIDSSIRSKVDFEISIPHWETPDVDKNGRWLSAPIWDIEHKKFLRIGRNQKAVESLLEEHEEDGQLGVACIAE